MYPAYPVYDTPLLILFFLLGLCLGSFASAIIPREKNNIPWFDLKGDMSRSACPSCGSRLGISELIPVFSWLLQKGKCKNCGAEISAFYPVVEVISGFCAVAVLYAIGLQSALILALFLQPFLLAFVYLALLYAYISKRLAILCILPSLMLYFLISA